MSVPTNAQIAAAFEELADLNELDGAVSYRVIAYRNAARAVRDATVSVAELAREGRATELSGIGSTLQDKVIALDLMGDIPAAKTLRARYPAGLVAVMHLPGFGPRRARRLHEELGIDSLEALRHACETHEIRKLRGFGEKVEQRLLQTLAAAPDGKPRPRILLSRALSIAEQLAGALRAHPAAVQVELAGSTRRMVDSVKDLDLVVSSEDPKALLDSLGEIPLIEGVDNVGDAGATIRTHAGLPVDLKVVRPEQFGNAMQHFTGSQVHNVTLREAAVKRGLHVSEYGILDDATGETTQCPTEECVYERLGLGWIPPELREGRGELEAAGPNGFGIPDLVSVADIRGDLHCHTTASDGRNTAEKMALAARDRGYEYLAITDHSATHGFGNHVSPDDLKRQIELVRGLNEELEGIELLVGTETNILLDGSVDYEDDLLAELDWVIGSVHTSFRMPREEMTARIVAAIEHPWVDAIGHLTGRKIESREPYDVDVERVIEAAARTGTMLEINSSPDRRDLNEIHARAAAQAGVKILINSDAHSTRTMSIIRYGVATARRAWLTPEHVANTRPWKEFAPLRKRARR